MKRNVAFEKQFQIPFSGLKPGIHEFEFEIDNVFFEQMEHSTAEKGDFRLSVVMDKKVNLLSLTVAGTGSITAPCDRCTEDVSVEVSFTEPLVVKFSSEAEDDEGIWVLPENEHTLHMAPIFSELIEVHIPMRIAHAQEDECNEEYLKDLQEEDSPQPIDPRWSELMKLKDTK